MDPKLKLVQASEADMPLSGQGDFRCPYCHDTISLVDLGTGEVLCPGCGSAFRLRDPRLTSTTAELRLLGKFQLLERVGQGAFGVVWRARDTELDRIVALKIPHASLVNSQTELERFHREARAAAQLRHPGIVTVHDVLVLDGLPTIVEDFITGVPLRDLLQAPRLSFQETALLVAEVAEALHYAHTMGLVHRDIKPGNIIVERANGEGESSRLGRPLLMDFGLALREEMEITLTVDGQILGTPAYMSPEQAAGKGHRVDRRSDVFSLGVVLYEMICGELPFRGSRLMLLDQVLHEEPRRPRRINDKIPRDLETICLRAMAKEPARRYASALDLAEDLRRFVRGEPIKARPQRLLERGWNWARRRPATAALLAVSVIAALALVGVAVGLAYNTRLQKAFTAEEDQRKRAETMLYFNRIVLAEREWQANNINRVEQLLEECPLSLRGWEWHYLKRLCHNDRMTLRGHTEEVGGLAYSPDGRFLASASWDRTVKVWDAKTGKLIRTLSLPGWAYRVAFSPNSQLLASASAELNKPFEVKVWEVDTGRLRHTLSKHAAIIYSVRFSPDGQRLASASADETARIWDVATGIELLALEDRKGGFTDVAFSPDGRWLATASGRLDVFVFNINVPEVKIWDAHTGQFRKSLRGHQGPITSLAFNNNGHLASGSYDRTAKIWDIKIGKEILTLRGHTQFVNGVAFSPDGQRLASASEDGSVKVWDAATGQEILSLRGHTGLVNGVAFSPDGLRLASGSEDKTVKIWDAMASPEAVIYSKSAALASSVAFSPSGKQLAWTTVDDTVNLSDGQKIVALHGHIGPVWKVAFSPDGSMIASAAGDWTRNDSPGEVIIWDVATGQKIRILPQSGVVWTVAFSPDGRQIASAGGELTNVPGEVKIWNPSTGEALCSLSGHAGGIFGLAFRPDGQRLASASGDGTVKIWDLNTKEESLTLRGHTGVVFGVAYSPDGQLLASTGEDKSVRIWDADSGQEIGLLRGHTNFVLAATFSPDGQRLGTASMDQTIKLWDVQAGQELLTLRGHTGSVFGVAFSPDSQRLASSSRDGTVRIWDATPMQEKPVPATNDVKK